MADDRRKAFSSTRWTLSTTTHHHSSRNLTAIGADNCSGTPMFAVSVSPLTGRSYRATQDIPAGTCVLDILTPYACTLYKRFRNEVCAECWKYDGGRRSFLTSRDFREGAGLSFCDERCKDAWLEREGEEMVALLKTLEATRRKAKGKDKATEAEVTAQLTAEKVEKSWDLIDQQSQRWKWVRRWQDIQLDDFEADMARYVLVALYHHAQETEHGRELVSSWH